jgi:hypothetical protein
MWVHILGKSTFVGMARVRRYLWSIHISFLQLVRKSYSTYCTAGAFNPCFMKVL